MIPWTWHFFFLLPDGVWDFLFVFNPRPFPINHLPTMAKEWKYYCDRRQIMQNRDIEQLIIPFRPMNIWRSIICFFVNVNYCVSWNWFHSVECHCSLKIRCEMWIIVTHRHFFGKVENQSWIKYITFFQFVIPLIFDHLSLLQPPHRIM